MEAYSTLVFANITYTEKLLRTAFIGGNALVTRTPSFYRRFGSVSNSEYLRFTCVRVRPSACVRAWVCACVRVWPGRMQGGYPSRPQTHLASIPCGGSEGDDIKRGLVGLHITTHPPDIHCGWFVCCGLGGHVDMFALLESSQ